jgi:thiamine pyrophosphate-dependent acetolactate synthase large subunit-like protein
MRVVDVVARCLHRVGVGTFFGVVGSGNFTFTTSLHALGVRFVAARHENGAVCMADAHARVSGELGCVSVHQGPGLTNAMTGLTEAAKARTPLILVAADTPAGAVGSNFYVDQDKLAEAVGAVPVRVNRPGSAFEDTERAIRVALRERRSVLLNVPLDVANQETDWDEWTARPPDAVREPPAPSPRALDEIAGLIAEAQRPLIVAGRGAVLADAEEALAALSERIGAPLATSAMGHGLFKDHPFSLGISGGFASPLAQEVIGASDLILAFGARLTRWTTGNGALIAPDARVVQVDLDESGFAGRADRTVIGDAGMTAGMLKVWLDRAGHRPNGRLTDDLRDRIAARRWRDEPFDDASNERHIDPRALTIALDDLLPQERTVVVDSGHFMGFPAMYLAVPDPEGFVFTQSFQSIGLGLANAVGAALARPDRLTVAALGDGGAMMGLQELETAARLRLPILFVVYDDAAYGAEVHHFRPMGHPVETVQFPDADFAAIARGAGCEGLTVRTLPDLEPVSAWLEGSRDRPLLVDAKVNPDVVAEWLEEAFRAA